MGKLKITQTRSIIKTLENQKRTIKALGLGRPHYYSILPDNPQTWGMIEKVKHLITVEKLPE
ncbi:MAG: 50S ribosomal protein L30 [Candidatus Kapaibacteriota bacterium]